MTHALGSNAVTVPPKGPLFAGALHDSVARVASTLRKLWEAYWRYRARKPTTVTLQSLDDRTLADLGLVRTELSTMVSSRPADRLYHWAPALHPHGRPRGRFRGLMTTT
jgi:uncharacterized protein YjiS (DUF1127 family)